MSKNARPRRSILYMPGSNARALEKGRTLAADGLILDLEDAVAPDVKEEARGRIRDAIKEGGYAKRELIVRVNAMDTSWGHDDLVAAATMGADAALLSPLFATRSHPGRAALGIQKFVDWCRRAPLPVYALGGITTGNARRLIHSGTAGIAAIGGWAETGGLGR